MISPRTSKTFKKSPFLPHIPALMT